MEFFVVNHWLDWKEQPLLTFQTIDHVRDFVANHTAEHYGADVTTSLLASTSGTNAHMWAQFAAGKRKTLDIGGPERIVAKRVKVED